MRIIKKYKAAFIYGKALKQFFNGNYKNAINYFERVLELEPRYGNRGYTRYYLGRSFFAVEDTERAKEEMSAAYNMLKKRIVSEKNEKDMNYFKSLTHEYIQLLSSLNEISLAQEIKDDKEKMVKKFGGKRKPQ
jgi:tetratricopeptide (TPR) repeat protein